jgi:predicted DNA-binding transcriptional regulator YafY
METAERVLRLVLFLQTGTHTRREIFQHLAVQYKIDRVAPEDKRRSDAANRMFERDLKFLEDIGCKIKKVRGHERRSSYHLISGYGPRLPFLFTEQEVDMLALLHTLFADPTQYKRSDQHQPLPLPAAHNPFARDVLHLIEKLVSALPPEQEKHFRNWTNQPFVYFQLSTVANYLPCRNTIAIIVRSIAHHKQIQFEYVAARQRSSSVFHEHIDPYYIVYQDGHFYLIAYSHKMDKFFEYRIDRIKHETLKEMPDRIDGARRRRPVEFRFWLDSSLARPGLSQRWLTQTQEREEAYIDANGHERRRVMVRATTYNEWRIIPQLLKYGDKAELVEPLYLREQMKQELVRISTLYKV